MLREVLHLTKGDLTNVQKSLHVKKKALPNGSHIRKIAIPLCQFLNHKLKELKESK